VDERIKKVMSAVFGVNATEINNDTSPDTLEEWDSLRHMSLIVALEEEFKMRFSNDEMAVMLNFSLVRAVLQKKCSII
jgi:acyl carrier protein